MKYKDTILGIVVAIWFIASLFGFAVLMESENKWLAPAVGGQIFLILGVVFIGSRMAEHTFGFSDLLLFIFPVLGIVGIVASFILRFGSEEFLNICRYYMIYAFLGVFTLAGIIMLVAWYRTTIWLKRLCTLRVEADCINVMEQYKYVDGRRVITFCPVFQFYYNGTIHEVCNNVFTNLTDFQEDQIYEIYINPNKTEQFYVPDQNNQVGIWQLIMGLAFTVFSIIVMVLYSRVI